MSNTLNRGDTVYNQHGQEAILVASSCGEHLVRPIFEDDDGSHEGDVETWRTVFRTPPAPKLDAETAAAEKRLHDLNAQVSAIRDQINEFNKSEKDRLARIKQHGALELLDRYLAGEITHYVAVKEYGFGVEIIPASDTLESYPSNNGYGLLTLQPLMGWNKQVKWSIYYNKKGESRYDNDRTERVFPCCGEEAARAKVAAIILAEIAAQMAVDDKDRRNGSELIKFAKAHGVEVPQELVDSVASARVAMVEREIAEKSKQIEALKQQLAATA